MVAVREKPTSVEAVVTVVTVVHLWLCQGGFGVAAAAPTTLATGWKIWVVWVAKFADLRVPSQGTGGYATSGCTLWYCLCNTK